VDGKDIAEMAVLRAQELQCSYAEARYIKSRNTTIAMTSGNVAGIGSSDSYGLGVRIIHSGGLSFFSLNNFNKDLLEKNLRQAIRLAQSSNRKDNPIEFVPVKGVEDSWKVDYKKSFADISNEEKLTRLQEIDKLSQQPWEAELVSRNIFYSDLVENKYLVTSDGSKITSELQRLYFTWNFRSLHKESGHEESRYSSFTRTQGWEVMEEEATVQAYLQDIDRTTKATARSKLIDFDSNVDFIISGEIQGIISHENCGHPHEADRILGREGAEAGESYIQEHILGESMIASEELTIIDDPTIPNSGGYYKYDDEGVPARKRELIKNGLLNELLHNRETAKIYGIEESNAAARVSEYNREPIIRMANTGFAPGSYSSDEIFEDVKKGIYLESFSEWNIDDRRYQCLYKGIVARLIENGTLTDTYIRRPTLELTTTALLKSVDAVTKDGFVAEGATCGKGNPMQGAPVWTFGNSFARLRSVPVRF